MLRGNGILATIAGLILVGASPNQDSQTSSEKRQTSGNVSQIKSARSPAIEPEETAPSEDKGCERGKDNRQSDLCAQWKAADAAHDAAHWAWWQMFAAGAALLLAGVTMAAAIFAAVYARRAAVATEGTVNLARETASRELRAYVSVTGLFVTPFRAGEAPIFSVEIHNNGNTPAMDLMFVSEPFFFEVSPTADVPIRFKEGFENASRSSLGAGHYSHHRYVLERKLTKQEVADLKSQKLGVAYAGVIKYRDIFRRRRFTTFQATFSPGGVMRDGHMPLAPSPYGNMDS